MKILVQKYGGTSVSTPENRALVIGKVKQAIDDGYAPVVVVSAMGRKPLPYATDTLLSLVDKKQVNAQDLDLLMGCGELISTVVMSTELHAAGIPARALSGANAGIMTDDRFGSASIVHIDPRPIMELCVDGIVPVVAGFQGATVKGLLTTLGRGGSDTTASALGEALSADAIEIYTDVDGVMTADPRLSGEAVVIDDLSYSEVFQMADEGAKVIHPRAVEIAMRSNIPLWLKNTFSDAPGTRISAYGAQSAEVEGAVKRVVTSIAHRKERVRVSVFAGGRKGSAVLDDFAAVGISIDLINFFPDRLIFTIGEEDCENADKLLSGAGIEYELLRGCAKVSAVGGGMRDVPGVMAKMVGALMDEGIEILQTADSHLTISCLVKEADLPKAVAALHREFELSAVRS